MTAHTFYTAKDFTKEEITNQNVLAMNVIEGGLEICKNCGAAEADLLNLHTCEEYKAWSRKNRMYGESIRKKHENRAKEIGEIRYMLGLIKADERPEVADVKNVCKQKLERAEADVTLRLAALESLPSELPQEKVKMDRAITCLHNSQVYINQ